MDPSLEIRKLPSWVMAEFSKILEPEDSWKKLMAIVPKTLSKEIYICDVTIDNLPKFRSEHFRIFEAGAARYKKTCTEIFLNEWGTSGRVRPALGHLKYLLIKAKLFRAADYVAVELLKETAPRRPDVGFAAPIKLSSREVEDAKIKQIEKILDEINYPSSVIENINKVNSVNTNINYSSLKNQPQKIPEIVISESPDVEEPVATFNMPVVVQSERPKESKIQKSDSKDSASSVTFRTYIEGIVPELSVLLNENTTEPEPVSIKSESFVMESQDTLSYPSGNLPDFNARSSENKVTTVPEGNVSEELDFCLPEISLLQNALLEKSDSKFSASNSSSDMSSVSNKSTSEEYSSHLPEFIKSQNALLDNYHDVNLPALSQLMLASEPNLGSENNLGGIQPNLSIFGSSLQNQASARPNSFKNSSRSCTSPLPNLTLDTLLPHHTYMELEQATNNFDETPLNQGGRFLGAGAFGKVYLAVNIVEKPVAVKQLLLDDVDAIHVDDTVTKMFRNEVEVLSKYKHENLLSLLGYSCDGCTYCLLYEYIPGGALKDRLQNKENKLIWTERLYIALGTSKAISYLHTAFDTPLIHRDVKSANILLDYTNRPKLCDFGLIKLLPSQNTCTGTSVFGTSAYMAPEAHRGDISVKLDSFSFGVVLLELLTSLPPLDENRDGMDLVTHVEDICEGDISPLLDKTAGSWMTNETNFAEKLFNIANLCLREKKKRPVMIDVTKSLTDLFQKQ